MKSIAPARLVRWDLRLAEYAFEIKYKKGDTNENADALSRLPVTDENPTLAVIVIGIIRINTIPNIY